MQFEVVGTDVYGRPIYQPVSGDGVMGDYDIDGEIMGEGHPAVTALARHHGHHHRAHGAPRTMAIPPKPSWRSQLAPGVIQPDEGMVPLPLAPQAGGGTFSATIPTITFQGQLQKPYRPERLLTSVVRTGTSATGRLLSQLYVGTDLQQADITGWDAEVVGQPTAFGTRLTCKAAEPGVFVRLIVTLSSVLAGTDTIFASLTFLGRVVH